MKGATTTHRLHSGVSLEAEVGGSGGPPILFVHGWCCDRSFLAPQAEYFAEHYRVVSMDLRGHGESTGAELDCSIERQSEDLVALVDDLGLDRPIVVGHSMGGVVALDMAVRYPEHVRAIAMLDSIVAPARQLIDAAAGLTLLLDSPRCAETIRDFVSEFLLGAGTDEALRRRALDTMSGADPRVALSVWESLLAYDDRGALKACSVPILFTAVEATLAGLDELPDLNPGLELVCMSGVCHFHPLEAPETTNAHLDRFVSRFR